MMEAHLRERWYQYYHEKYGISVEHLRRDYEGELMGNNPMEAPLEVPDKMEVLFKYSLGRQSRFFRELRENRLIYGAKCIQCGRVYCPPRADCHVCYKPTEWAPLEGTGVIKACTVQYFTTSAFVKKLPFICAYVQLDGTDGLLMTNMEVEDVTKIKVGTRVKAVFREERHGAITDFYFRPVE